MKMSWLRLCVALGLLVGCGDDDDSDSDESELSEQAPAYDECVQYADVVCSKGMSCGVELGELTSSESKREYDDCFRLTKKGLDCSKAIATSSSYDQCISSVRSLKCDPFFYDLTSGDPSALPSSCRGALTIAK